MNKLTSTPRSLLRLTTLLPVALLAACGGGGGGSDSPYADPSVTSASVSPTMYSQTAVVTVNGSQLDSGLSVTSNGCEGMTLSSAAPYVSTATTAYYTCSVIAVGSVAFTVARTSDNTPLATPSITVLMPQVTITVDNGLTGPGELYGSMVLALRPDVAPVTVRNFMDYVNSGFYVGTVFDRIVPGFVIQGGGNLADGTPQTPTLPPIALESTGLSNVAFSLAMARSSDPNSATSQFFVNLGDNSATLDPVGPPGTDGYAVFGSVLGDTSLVTAIATASPCNLALPTTPGCTPSTPIVITAATQTQ